jgi:hypothetical protein
MSKPLDLQSYAFDLNEDAARTLDKFTTDLRANPKYAMEWRGEGAIEAACQIEVAAYITRWHESAKETGATEANVNAAIIQHAVAEVLRYSERTNQSTSPISNLVERFMLAQWSKIATKAFEKARFSGDNITVVFQALPSSEAGMTQGEMERAHYGNVK